MKALPAFLGACMIAVSTARAADTLPPVLELGSTAPDFTLPGVDERNWSLGDFADSKLLVVIFTCNHCPTARYYEDRIKQLVTDYKDKGVALVAISPNDPASVRLDELGWTDLSDSLDEMKLRADHAEFNFPYLYDGDPGEASRQYGPTATPHAFVFDAGRRLRYVGAIDDSERIQHVKTRYVRDALDALLDGREPPVTKTRAVGCSVKWAGKQDDVKSYMERLAKEPVTLTPAGVDELSALRRNDSGKFRLVNFWATWCAPCIAEYSEFVTINRMYRHRDFELVMVSMNRPDESAQVLDFLKERQSSNRNLIFASPNRDPLIEAFNPKWEGQVPYTVLINPEGDIIHEEIGSIDPLGLKREIVKAMNERKPW
ncbi:MAG TPA: redoxin domain-containing protein [Methylomirabilota bacterium]|nr:redoxin domain-containing protein [Methylomirabilota bacterium]